jgi:hypothetical protein
VTLGTLVGPTVMEEHFFHTTTLVWPAAGRGVTYPQVARSACLANLS